eukprot:maker-scaffold86_size395752-snap-gene-2.30 protein:Tk10884 transcript:maker-scaffold86_size395752-snap-gene-2.30-mRNA-1 annotation:"---NA---"
MAANLGSTDWLKSEVLVKREIPGDESDEALRQQLVISAVRKIQRRSQSKKRAASSKSGGRKSRSVQKISEVWTSPRSHSPGQGHPGRSLRSGSTVQRLSFDHLERDIESQPGSPWSTDQLETNTETAWARINQFVPVDPLAWSDPANHPMLNETMPGRSLVEVPIPIALSDEPEPPTTRRGRKKTKTKSPRFIAASPKPEYDSSNGIGEPTMTSREASLTGLKNLGTSPPDQAPQRGTRPKEKRAKSSAARVATATPVQSPIRRVSSATGTDGRQSHTKQKPKCPALEASAVQTGSLAAPRSWTEEEKVQPKAIAESKLSVHPVASAGYASLDQCQASSTTSKKKKKKKKKSQEVREPSESGTTFPCQSPASLPESPKSQKRSRKAKESALIAPHRSESPESWTDERKSQKKKKKAQHDGESESSTWTRTWPESRDPSAGGRKSKKKSKDVASVSDFQVAEAGKVEHPEKKTSQTISLPVINTDWPIQEEIALGPKKKKKRKKAQASASLEAIHFKADRPLAVDQEPMGEIPKLKKKKKRDFDETSIGHCDRVSPGDRRPKKKRKNFHPEEPLLVVSLSIPDSPTGPKKKKSQSKGRESSDIPISHRQLEAPKRREKKRETMALIDEDQNQSQHEFQPVVESDRVKKKKKRKVKVALNDENQDQNEHEFQPLEGDSSVTKKKEKKRKKQKPIALIGEEQDPSEHKCQPLEVSGLVRKKKKKKKRKVALSDEDQDQSEHEFQPSGVLGLAKKKTKKRKKNLALGDKDQSEHEFQPEEDCAMVMKVTLSDEDQSKHVFQPSEDLGPARKKKKKKRAALGKEDQNKSERECQPMEDLAQMEKKMKKKNRKAALSAEDQGQSECGFHPLEDLGLVKKKRKKAALGDEGQDQMEYESPPLDDLGLVKEKKKRKKAALKSVQEKKEKKRRKEKDVVTDKDHETRTFEEPAQEVKKVPISNEDGEESEHESRSFEHQVQETTNTPHCESDQASLSVLATATSDRDPSQEKGKPPGPLNGEVEGTKSPTPSRLRRKKPVKGSGQPESGPSDFQEPQKPEADEAVSSQDESSLSDNDSHDVLDNWSSSQKGLVPVKVTPRRKAQVSTSSDTDQDVAKALSRVESIRSPRSESSSDDSLFPHRYSPRPNCQNSELRRNLLDEARQRQGLSSPSARTVPWDPLPENVGAPVASKTTRPRSNGNSRHSNGGQNEVPAVEIGVAESEHSSGNESVHTGSETMDPDGSVDLNLDPQKASPVFLLPSSVTSRQASSSYCDPPSFTSSPSSFGAGETLNLANGHTQLDQEVSGSFSTQADGSKPQISLEPMDLANRQTPSRSGEGEPRTRMPSPKVANDSDTSDEENLRLLRENEALARNRRRRSSDSDSSSAADLVHSTALEAAASQEQATSVSSAANIDNEGSKEHVWTRLYRKNNPVPVQKALDPDQGTPSASQPQSDEDPDFKEEFFKAEVLRKEKEKRLAQKSILQTYLFTAKKVYRDLNAILESDQIPYGAVVEPTDEDKAKAKPLADIVPIPNSNEPNFKMIQKVAEYVLTKEIQVPPLNQAGNPLLSLPKRQDLYRLESRFKHFKSGHFEDHEDEIILLRFAKLMRKLKSSHKDMENLLESLKCIVHVKKKEIRRYGRAYLAAYVGLPLLHYRRFSDIFAHLCYLMCRQTPKSAFSEETVKNIVDYLSKHGQSKLVECREALKISPLVDRLLIKDVYWQHRVAKTSARKTMFSRDESYRLLRMVTRQTKTFNINKIDHKKIDWVVIDEELGRPPKSAYKHWEVQIKPVLLAHLADIDVIDTEWMKTFMKMILADKSITRRRHIDYGRFVKKFPTQTEYSLKNCIDSKVDPSKKKLEAMRRKEEPPMSFREQVEFALDNFVTKSLRSKSVFKFAIIECYEALKKEGLSSDSEAVDDPDSA